MFPQVTKSDNEKRRLVRRACENPPGPVPEMKKRDHPRGNHCDETALLLTMAVQRIAVAQSAKQYRVCTAGLCGTPTVILESCWIGVFL